MAILDKKERLWIEYSHSKSTAVREELIMEYVSLVKLVAGRLAIYLGANVEYDDLVSYGIFGLIDAIDKFDYGKGIKFETYASLRIRGSILDQIRKMDWIPRSVRQKQKSITEASKKLEALKVPNYSDADMAKELGISEEEYDTWMQQTNVTNISSLDDFMEPGNDVKAPAYHGTGVNPENRILKEELKTQLTDAIDITTFLSIVNGQTGMNAKRPELESWLKDREAVRGQQMYFFEGGYILSEEYRTKKEGEVVDYHQLLERQGAMSYYIPAKSELLRYADPYYVEKTPSYAAFCRFIQVRLGRPENEAAVIGSHIQLIMRHGAMPKDIFAEMERFGLTEENEELMSDFITVMMDMYNNTRMPETRGFTTVEAQKADPSRQKKIANASEIVTSSMPIVKNRIGGKKIYPNDLCPCGSGKKYKKCCGRVNK